MENKVDYVRTHRVGSFTAGISMIFFGVMFLLHLIVGKIGYIRIFSLWPIVLIGLGVELFLSNIMRRKIVYDKAAVFLLLTMTLFAMLMAFADVCIQAGYTYLDI